MDQHSPDDSLALRPLLMKMLVGLLVLGAVLGGLALAFKAQLLAVSVAFVETLGTVGVFLGWFVADGLTVPLPVDVFLALGLLGGLTPWEVFLAAALGSILGGCVGWSGGVWLRHLARFQRWWARSGADAEALVRRYGVTALVVAALSPLPFSIVCWASGALHMPFRHFFPVCCLRVLRVGGYLWLIVVGLLEVV